jgi:predicted PhzF superfamily epimerase YddE/YHI9
MQIEYFHIDAFTDRAFAGNPAGVCLLEQWLAVDLMQRIASENGLSETTFIIPTGPHFEIRWFTPEVEIDLCGHGTLAAAHVLIRHKGFTGPFIEFYSQTDRLLVENAGDVLVLNFPSRPPVPCSVPVGLYQALGDEPTEVLSARDYLAVFPSEENVRKLKPDIDRLSHFDKAVIVTARGKEVDFVSRFFAPLFGIPEDPVTGSSHCTLVPYWSKQLAKSSLVALQVSPRGGRLYCQHLGDRVKIGGKAVTYLQGYLSI